MGIDIDVGVDAKFEMESNDDNDKIDDGSFLLMKKGLNFVI